MIVGDGFAMPKGGMPGPFRMLRSIEAIDAELEADELHEWDRERLVAQATERGQ
jgi:hypothetical protein